MVFNQLQPLAQAALPASRRLPAPLPAGFLRRFPAGFLPASDPASAFGCPLQLSGKRSFTELHSAKLQLQLQTPMAARWVMPGGLLVDVSAHYINDGCELRTFRIGVSPRHEGGSARQDFAHVGSHIDP